MPFGTRFNVAAISAAFLLAAGTLVAQDKITLKSGEVVEGEVVSIDKNRNILMKVAQGQLPYPSANIARVEMAVRPQVAQAQQLLRDGKNQEAVDLVKPLVDKYLGIDVPWIPEAAGVEAEGLLALGKTGEGGDLYAKIGELYQTSVFRFKGDLGKARAKLAEGDTAGALAILDTVEKQLDPGVVPDSTKMPILSELYLLRGDIYAKTDKPDQALLAYIKVSTLYYSPTSRAEVAQKKADDLKRKNAKLVVE